MRKKIASCLLSLLAISLAAKLSARDLSKYPCTVFNSDACFRLPTGTHVGYSVPIDFHLYVVMKGSSRVATIYIGNAPQKIKNSSDVAERITLYGTIKILKEKSELDEMVDIYIIPISDARSTIHVSANVVPEIKEELHEVLSSLRPCAVIKSGGQKCPKNDVWSKELTEALSL